MKVGLHVSVVEPTKLRCGLGKQIASDQDSKTSAPNNAGYDLSEAAMREVIGDGVGYLFVVL